ASFYQHVAIEYVRIGNIEKARPFVTLAFPNLGESSQAYTFMLIGELEKAKKRYEKLIAEEPDNILYQARMGALLAKLGRKEEAQQKIQWLLERKTQENAGEQYYFTATIFSQLGELSEAFQALERAYDNSLSFSSTNYGHDPLLSPLNGYEPFEQFVEPKAMEEKVVN
ncbi:MAG: hypothetical protein R3350_06975, partial [Saprospiraceae bacterium]|nr:hypothetical protein [Saprospiraceae bacterium]